MLKKIAVKRVQNTMVLCEMNYFCSVLQFSPVSDGIVLLILQKNPKYSSFFVKFRPPVIFELDSLFLLQIQDRRFFRKYTLHMVVFFQVFFLPVKIT